VQDSLRNAVIRLAAKRAVPIKLERNTQGLKQINIDTDDNHNKQIDVEFNYKRELAATRRQVHIVPPLTSNYNLVGSGNDLETTMRLMNDKENNGSLISQIITSVADFGEPTDIEISNMHASLSYIFNEHFAKSLFSFETAIINHAIDSLKKMNIFNKRNMLKLYQYIFIRVFDTQRRGILEPVESLLEFMVKQSQAMQISFADEKETTVVFHTLVRFFLSCSNINVELLMRYLPLVNIDQMTNILYRLFNNPLFFQKETLLVSLSEIIIVQFANGGLSLTSEFLLYLKSIEFSYKKQISDIFKAVEKKASQQGLTQNQEIANLFIHEQQESVFRTDDFHKIDHLLTKIESGAFTTVDLLNNAEEIVNCLITHGNELILFEKFKDLRFKNSRMESFLLLLQKLSQVKGIMDKLSSSLSQNLIEQLVLYLIKMDKSKETVTGRVSGRISIIDEVIKVTNMAILKFLELNSPNILYESLFGVLDIYSHGDPFKNHDILQKTHRPKLNGILVKCIIKLTKALKQVLDKLDIPRLLSLLNEYVINYNNEIDDMGMKCIKTIVHELVALKGEGVMASLDQLSMTEPPAIMLIINKYVSKNKSGAGVKEDVKKDTKTARGFHEGITNSNSKSKSNGYKKNPVTSIEIEDNNFEKH
jgi:hypothetical protein